MADERVAALEGLHQALHVEVDRIKGIAEGHVVALLQQSTDLQQQSTDHRAELERQYEEQKRQHDRLDKLYNDADKQLATLNAFMNRSDQQAVSGGNKGKGGKGQQWQMTRPKDLLPATFSGKDEDWQKWKEDIEDYVDAIGGCGGSREILRKVAKSKEEITISFFTWGRQWHRRSGGGMAQGKKTVHALQK